MLTPTYQSAMNWLKLEKKSLWLACLACFLRNCFYSFINISTMVFNYTQINMKQLFWPQPNTSSIRERCDNLGTDWLSSFDDNLWATGRLRVNLTSGRGGLITFPLLLFKGNAILSMTPKAGCGIGLFAKTPKTRKNSKYKSSVHQELGFPRWQTEKMQWRF